MPTPPTRASWLTLWIPFAAVAGCAEGPTGPPGTLELTVSTTGPDRDRDGYQLLVDGLPGPNVGPDAEVSLSVDLAAGPHELRLHSVQSNCSAETISVDIPPAATAAADLAVVCEELPSVRGLIVWSRDYSFWSMNPDGSDAKPRIRVASGFTWAPSISPDGKWLAYTHQLNETWKGDVMVANFNGDPPRAIARSEWVEQEPTWMPDGRLAFVSNRDGGGEQDLYVVDPWSDAKPAKLRDETHQPEWSPDGSRVVFMGGATNDIGVMSPDGTGVTWLTSTSHAETEPHWSPDGGRIAFAANDADVGDILTMNADGTGITRVVGSDDWDGNPTWSPDGSRILFSRRIEVGHWEVYMIDLASGELVHLTAGVGGSNGAPMWVP